METPYHRYKSASEEHAKKELEDSQTVAVMGKDVVKRDTIIQRATKRVLKPIL